MPRRRYLSNIQLTVVPPPIVVVIDHSLAELLGVRLAAPFDSTNINSYLTTQASKLARLPAWLGAFRRWVLSTRPTLISLSPDTVLDSVLFNDFLTAQSYGMGVPAHVPALFKPNGSLNWLRFDKKASSTSTRGLYSMGKNGLFCFSASYSRPFALPHGAEPATSALEDHQKILKPTRDEARRRLECATQVLLLGVNPKTMQPSDTALISGLNPSKKLTVVTPKTSHGKELRTRCELHGDLDIQLDSIDSWVSSLLHQWAAE